MSIRTRPGRNTAWTRITAGWGRGSIASAAFNANNDYLYFPDGSFWLVNVTSGSSEQDAGTMYPSTMEDTNGNFVQVTYAAAAGYYSGNTNTSSRILNITASRRNQPSP